jgi:hypothetical protein
MLWSVPTNVSGEINLEVLLGAMAASEAILYRVLIQLIPAPSAEAPNRGGRQIEMALLAKLTGYTKRWVIELMQRLEDKNFIRTDGGSGAVKWIWLLPPGVLRLGKSFPTKLARRKKTSPGKAKAPRAAAPRPKHRPQGNGAEPESGCRSQRRPDRGETAGDSSPAPERTDAIDPAGTKQPCSGGHHGDTATTTGTSRSDVARRHGATGGAKQPSGGCHHGDTSTFKGTPRRRSTQPKGAARRQDRTAAFHAPRRPCSRQRGGARRNDVARAFTGPGRSGSR